MPGLNEVFLDLGHRPLTFAVAGRGVRRPQWRPSHDRASRAAGSEAGQGGPVRGIAPVADWLMAADGRLELTAEEAAGRGEAEATTTPAAAPWCVIRRFWQ